MKKSFCLALIAIMLVNILSVISFAESGAENAVTLHAEYADEDTLGKMQMNRMKSSTEYGIGGRNANDASGKFTVTDIGSSSDFYTNTYVSQSLAANDITVSVSVFPNATVKEIYFATNGHAPLSQKVSVSSLNQNEWNTLALVYDKDGQNSELYVNGEYKSSLKYAIGNNLRIVFGLEKTHYADGYIYYDDMAVYSGKISYPAAAFEKYTVDGIFIHGYGNDSVSEFKSNAVFPRDGYTLKVYSVGGDELDDGQRVQKGRIVKILDGDVCIARYILGIPLTAAAGECMLFNEGYASPDGKFGSGNVLIKQKFICYGGKQKVTAAAALFDEKGSVVNVSYDVQTISGENYVSAALEIDKERGRKLKFYVFESDTLMPLCKVSEFAPYSDDKIESAAPLYKGFTVKSAVFNYDDCAASDIRMVELLDKYNAKGTFNLVGKYVLDVMRGRCRDKTGRDDDESVFEFVKNVYSGHEISSHTFSHRPAYLNPGEIGYDSKGNTLVGVSTEEEVADIKKGVSYLKQNLGIDGVIGLAWPNGYGTVRTDYQSDLLPAMKESGIKYARGIENGKFDLPNDWYVWNATCHHKNAPSYAEKFISLQNEGNLKCFFVWGHTYEFDENADNDNLNWNMIESVIKSLSGDNIWLASNGEIYNYVEAVKKADITDTEIRNNSDLTLYFNVNGKNTEIPAGEIYNLSQALLFASKAEALLQFKD